MNYCSVYDTHHQVRTAAVHDYFGHTRRYIIGRHTLHHLVPGVCITTGGAGLRYSAAAGAVTAPLVRVNAATTAVAVRAVSYSVMLLLCACGRAAAAVRPAVCTPETRRKAGVHRTFAYLGPVSSDIP